MGFLLFTKFKQKIQKYIYNKKEMEELLLTALTYFSIIWVGFSQLQTILLKKRLFKLVNIMCLKCFTFWIVLILTFNLPLAAISALMAFIFDNNFNNTTI